MGCQLKVQQKLMRWSSRLASMPESRHAQNLPSLQLRAVHSSMVLHDGGMTVAQKCSMAVEELSTCIVQRSLFEP